VRLDQRDLVLGQIGTGHPQPCTKRVADQLLCGLEFVLLRVGDNQFASQARLIRRLMKKPMCIIPHVVVLSAPEPYI
jgi:hypothetical protein